MAWKKVGYGDTLKNGVKGDPVCDVQRFLYLLKTPGIPFKTSDIDGLYGQKTVDGVKYYQAYGMGQVGKGVDGIVGPKTWAAMKKGVGANAINPDAKGLVLTKNGC